MVTPSFPELRTRLQLSLFHKHARKQMLTRTKALCALEGQEGLGRVRRDSGGSEHTQDRLVRVRTDLGGSGRSGSACELQIGPPVPDGGTLLASLYLHRC